MDNIYREYAQKAAVIRESNAAFGDADWTACSNGLAAGTRQGLPGMTIAVAGDATVNAVAPMLAYQFCLLLAQIVDGGIAADPRFTTAQTLTMILDANIPGIVAQKIPYPEHAYRPTSSSCFRVVAYSGIVNAQLAAQSVLPIGSIFSLGNDNRILVLSPVESDVLGQMIASEEKGKISSAHNQPFLHLARTQAITADKRALFGKVKRLQSLFGDAFVTTFSKPEDFPELNNGTLSIEYFTMEIALNKINLALKTYLDPEWLGDGLQFTMPQVTAIVTFNFGTSKDQISIATIVKTSEKKHGIKSINQVTINLQFALNVLAILFDREVIERMNRLFSSIKDELLPSTSTQYIQMVDAFLSAAQNPPININVITWLNFSAWNTSTDNVQYRKYHQAQLDVEKEKQQAINDATLAATTALREEIRDIHKAKPLPSNGAKQGTKRKVSATKTATDIKDKKAVFLNALKAHGALEPKDGSVPPGTKPLCPRVANDQECVSKSKGFCDHCSHDKTASMTPAYIQWCKDRPRMNKVTSK